MDYFVLRMFALLGLISAALSMCVVNMDAHLEQARVVFTPYVETFNTFKQSHGKTYKDDVEESYRLSVFIRNVKQMEEHNMKYHRGETTYYMNVNHFSDMTYDEYLRYNHLGRYSQAYNKKDLAACFPYVPAQNRPSSIDWREKGAVTAIKDQGQCGSCYTFSATGSIEGQNFKNTGTLLSFSEQQIVDCCNEGEGCSGCNGGLMDTTFLYINKTGGLELETDYAYKAETGSCSFSSSKTKVKISGCSDIPENNEAALQDAVGNVGPISIAIDASPASFMAYAGGIYNDPSCSSQNLDHGVLAVGYGTSNGTDYWIVKNSWGTTWGSNGYIKMIRNNNNQCGIASMASFPHTAK